MTVTTNSSPCTVVRPESSSLNAITGRDVVRQARPCVESGGTLVLDLQYVDYLNSEALGYITMICRRIHHHHGQIHVCGLNSEPSKLFRMTRLTDLLDGVHASVADAITACQQP